MGFFYNDNSPKKKRPLKKEMPVELLRELGCKACPRNTYKKLKHPKMEPEGAKHNKADIYILGSAPVERDDAKGELFMSQSGRVLREAIPGRYEKRIRWSNALRCRTPSDRPPLPQEVECCRVQQEEDIAKHKPQVIVLVGFAAVAWLLRVSKPGIGVWRGRWLPVAVQGHKCFAYVILDPLDAVVRAKGKKYASDNRKLIHSDLAAMFKAIKRGLPTPEVYEGYEGDPVQCFGKGTEIEFKKIEKIIRAMMKEKLCATDIEATGLRPYKTAAKMVSASIATKKQGTISFPVRKTGVWKTKQLEKKIQKLYGEFLASPIIKVCHNTKFEQEWFAYEHGMEMILNTNWDDTMAQAYVLDSRKGMLNLGALTLLYFGFNVKLLSAIDVKKADEADTMDLLLYGGLDSKWTLELYYEQKKKIRKEGLHKVVAERVRTGATLVGAQLVGVPIDKKVADRLGKKLAKLYRKQLRKARKTRAWIKFVKKVGRDPNPDSHTDMVELFDKIMKVKECRTEAGGITTADVVLSKLSEKRYPVAPIILEMRSIETVKSMYVDKLPNVLYPDGRLHTSYQHLFTTSSRLSSEDPNLQNWPKHKWKMLREMIREKNKIVVSFDYGQIEARVIAMASEDPVFVQMLWDTYDVHMDWADRIYKEYHGALSAIHIEADWDDGGAKLYRQEVKNKWVFPLFFGSNERSVAGNLNLPQDVASYLYHEFWSVFEGIKEWQERTVHFYNKHGYVETLTGKRRYAPCSYNEIINHPIQGTASDIVIDASTRLQDKGIQFHMNVHDDLTFIMEDDPKLIRRIAREMCRPTFDFINVPLLIEIESGPNWYEQKPIAEYSSDKDFKFH